MMPTTSFPKEKIKVLLLENIHDDAVHFFEQHGYKQVQKLSKALSEAELIDALQEVHLLGIRSKTQLTARVLEQAPKLLAAGCYCIGTNQVALQSAAWQGIPIFNAPYSNTRSVAELVIGTSIMLIRKILPKNEAAHQGVWLKQADRAFELRGKKLGIIGYGNIGSQVSVMAEGMGMQVLYFDIQKKLPLGNARPCLSMEEVLREADIVTLHIPEAPGGVAVLDHAAIAQIKKGACLINYARGSVVDLVALKQAYDLGNISGVALDVFPEEPERNGDAFDCPFLGAENALLTPHIGGSTEEAQAGIAIDVSEKLLAFLESGNSHGSQSIPELSLPIQTGLHRILHIHRNEAGVLSAINSTLSDQGINISSQYLKTNTDIGYVVLDIAQDLSEEATQLLRKVKGTLKVRLLY